MLTVFGQRKTEERSGGGGGGGGCGEKALSA